MPVFNIADKGRRAGGAACALALLLIAGRPAAAALGAGTTAGNFLKIDAGPRPAALGGSYTGLADDAYAIAYNPAGLARMRRMELSLAHNEFLPGVRQEWLAFAYPGEWGTIAASANVLYVDPFPAYSAADSPIGNTSSMDAAYGLDYARGFGDSWSVGGGVKYLQSRLDTNSSADVAFDAGVLFQPWPQLGLGASLLNAGGGQRFIDQTFALPLTYKFGAAFKPLVGFPIEDELTLLADVSKSIDGNLAISGGVEYVYTKVLALRAGGRSDQSTGPGYTLGMGILLHRGRRRGAEIDFDYAFADYGALGLVNRGGLTVKFGAPRLDRVEAAMERRSDEAPLRPRERAASEPKRSTDEAQPDMIWVAP